MGDLKKVGYPTRIAPRSPMQICCWCGEVFFSITGKRKYCCVDCLRRCHNYRRRLSRRINRKPQGKIGEMLKKQFQQLDLQLFAYCNQPHLANKITSHMSSDLPYTVIISRYNPDGMIAWQYYFSRNDDGTWDLTRSDCLESVLRDNKPFRLSDSQLKTCIELATMSYERFRERCRRKKIAGW